MVDYGHGNRNEVQDSVTNNSFFLISNTFENFVVLNYFFIYLRCVEYLFYDGPFVVSRGL